MFYHVSENPTEFLRVGDPVGKEVGDPVGKEVGLADGDPVGKEVGLADGANELAL